jgi:hypothetical protein
MSIESFTLPAVGELPSDNRSMDEFTHELSVVPENVLSYLENPETYNWPDVCASVAAAAQRCVMSETLPLKKYLRYRASIANTLIEGGHWDEILDRVGRNDLPAGYEIQLVVQSAQQTDGDMHIRPTGALKRVINNQGWNSRAWLALRSFVEGRHKQYFNVGSGQLLAIGQMEVMRRAVFPYMDVSGPDPLADVMTGQLSGYLKQSKQSFGTGASAMGGTEFAPGDVWHVAKAMEQYREDREAYQDGQTQVQYAYGRKWRRLMPGGEQRYQDRIRERQEIRKQSDDSFCQAFTCTPEILGQVLRGGLRGIDEEGDYVASSESLGAAWAAAILRQNEPGIKKVINLYYRTVQKHLEPYVLDGLPLIAGGSAPLWLKTVALESWYDNNNKTSVSTPAYGPESDDYRAIGQAMNEYIRGRYMKPVAGDSGYDSRMPQIGIIMAYDLLVDTVKSVYPPKGMMRNLTDLYQSTITGVPRKYRQRVFGRLPREVHKAVADPGSFQRKLLSLGRR